MWYFDKSEREEAKMAQLNEGIILLFYVYDTSVVRQTTLNGNS